MLAMPLRLTRNGAFIPKNEIESIRYAFSEVGTVYAPIVAPEKTEEAHSFDKEGFLIAAPFTIMHGGWPSQPSITPLYRSLYLCIVFTDKTSFTMTIPVISSTELNYPIVIDIPKF